MKRKTILSLLVAILAAVVFNAFVGAAVALVMGYAWWKGAVILNLVAIALGPVFKRGRVYAGVHQEVWTGVMLKKLREAEENLGWLAAITDYSEYVQNEVIHFVELGGDPDVLINNSTYPLAVQTLEDADRPISLDTYETKATPISERELETISYDKLGSVQERHRENVSESRYRKSLHALAPTSHNATDSPVLLTSGSLTGESPIRRRLTKQDLLALKKWFDARKVPNKERILVLCPDHVQDLLLVDEQFAKQYNLDTVDGRIGRLYSFDIYEYTDAPYYTVSTKTKAPYGAVIGDTHRQASVAYHSKSMMRATGTLKTYHSDAKTDPLHHRHLFNVALRAICLPLRSKGCTAAVVSDVSASGGSGGGEGAQGSIGGGL